MKKATRSLESHFKNLKEEKQKFKGFCRILGKRKQEENDKKLGKAF
jgi:hypothetical protein